MAGSLCLMTSVGTAIPAHFLPLAFFGVRSACLGMIFPWINTVIGQWFKRYRGRAVGYKGVCIISFRFMYYKTAAIIHRPGFLSRSDDPNTLVIQSQASGLRSV
jgi:hypothetical protein